MEYTPAVVYSTVITMNWTRKYCNREEFMAYFLTEQEYVDAMFAMIVMYNFGVCIMPEEMYVSYCG